MHFHPIYKQVAYPGGKLD